MRAVSGLVLVVLSVGCSNNDNGLTAQDRAPDAVITAPGVGDAVVRGMVDLTGVVDDDLDPIETLTAIWSLDDEVLGDSVTDADGNVALTVDFTDVERGPHTVFLAVTDSRDQLTITQVAINIVGAPGVPDVIITSPDDGVDVAPGTELTFRGEGSDSDTPVEELEFRWWSDVDGDLTGAISADGLSILFWDGLTIGTHVVTLEVEDEDGEVGEDSVTVFVSDAPVIAEPGDLVFTELMINPQVVQDEIGEWVELYNTSGSPIDVAGYTFRDDDNDTWILEGPFIVPPHGYFVLCAETNPALNGGVPCDGGFNRSTLGDGMALANRVDEVVLSRPDGVEVGRIAYDSSWFTNAIATGVDPAVLGTPAQTDKNEWCDQLTILSPMTEAGTPGQPNDPCN